jgi:carbon monoxide dehydrogenase subunit G
MNLEWHGHEEVAASKEQLWRFINDPANVAQCIPDLVESTVRDAHNFDAVVKVGVGPVSGKFKLKVALDPQPGGERMNMKISGGGFGSAVDLVAGADIKDNGNATTSLDWSGSATMRGPIATVGGRVIDAQAQRVISTTFANVKARCASSSA